MGADIELLWRFLWDWLIARGKPRDHWRRYVVGATVSIAGILVLCAAYMLLLPKRYTSEWSIILPGAGVEARVSVDRLGQAQSSASSPFSAKEISPRVNYKEIAGSRPVVEAAAKSLGLEPDSFPDPKIKLIDQTSIVEFKITAGSAEDAQNYATALHVAFKDKLEGLRNDELNWRNHAIRDSLGDVRVNLSEARANLLKLQLSSGLASVEQYNQLVASIEALRRDHSAAQALLAERRAQVAALSQRLDVTPDAATKLLLITSSPEYRQLTQSYAATNALNAENITRLGPQHPRVLDQSSKLASLRSEIEAHLAKRGLSHSSVVSTLLVSAEHDRIVGLLTDLLQRSSEMAGLESRVADIARLLDHYEARRQGLNAVAAKLDDLERDHKIANAVFSSALARIDVSKSDIYASYPLIQMLEPPTLPEKPSSPRLVFAVAGAILGSLLAIMGWTFAWLHQWFASVRLMKRSSTLRSA